MQQRISKKIIVDFNKLRSLFRINCPEHLIIQALKLDPVEKTGDELIDDLLESLVDYKEFDNWGGNRLGAGRKPKNQLENQDDKINLKIKNNNQLENQDDKIKMIKSRCNQVVDKDIDIDKENIDKGVSIYTRFYVECQNFDEIPPKILSVMKKYWTTGKINEIRTELACMPSHDTSVQELLERYPSDITKRFVKPTLDEVRAYCRERNNTVDPERFMDFYESNGWKVGKNPMKDWRSAVRNWERSGYNTTTKTKKTNPMLDPCEDNFLRENPAWWLDDDNKKDEK